MNAVNESVNGVDRAVQHLARPMRFIVCGLGKSLPMPHTADHLSNRESEEHALPFDCGIVDVKHMPDLVVLHSLSRTTCPQVAVNNLDRASGEYISSFCRYPHLRAVCT